MSSLFSIEYTVNTTYVNANKKLGLYGLMCMLQDAASVHAIKLGFGYEDMKSSGIFWVLSRQKIIMKRWPDWREKVQIKTWTKPVESFYAYREFQVLADGQVIGECSTMWLILDSNTHRPKKADFLNETVKPHLDDSLNFTAGKVVKPEETNVDASFLVRNSDIDMNQHVNNTKYAQWVLDSIPFDLHSKFTLKEFEINFLNESFLGDEIEVSSHRSIAELNHNLTFMGKRSSDSKSVFLASMKAEQLS
ncbi:MAG: acyl-[acyl-carrier-protein] thioesterase [Bacteroidetes bacterium]|nr:acyl-[acyl-carrier-protein] thioesterase [Bacteroidota bacterium]